MHIMYVSTYVYIYVYMDVIYIYTIYVRKPWPEFAFLMIVMGKQRGRLFALETPRLWRPVLVKTGVFERYIS